MEAAECEENRHLWRGQDKSFGSSRGLGFGKLAFEVDFNLGPVQPQQSQLDYCGLEREGHGTGIWKLGGVTPLPSKSPWDEGQDLSFSGPQSPQW